MHQLLYPILVIVALSSATAAVDTVADLPSCGQACVAQAAEVSGCSVFDQTCLCNSVKFLNAVDICEAANCSTADQALTFGHGAVIYLVSQNICAAVGGVPSAAIASVTAPRFFTSAPVVTAISSISASAVSVAYSVLASLPSCAPPCIDAANAALGPRGCLVGDPAYLKCICTNTDFLCPIYKCEIANCSSAELAQLPRFEYCAQFGRTQFNDVCVGKPNGTTSAVGPTAITSHPAGGGGGGSNGSVPVPPKPPSPTPSPFPGLAGHSITAGWAVELAAIAGGFAVVLMWL